MENLGVVGALQEKGISGAAQRLINTKKLEFTIFNKSDVNIYNMKKFGDISTLSTGDKVKPSQSAVLKSQGIHTASGVVTFRIKCYSSHNSIQYSNAWHIEMQRGKNYEFQL